MLNLILQKMPLSSLIRGLLERCFSPAHLDAIFARHAHEQYTRQLLFSTVCDLLLSVVLQVNPSIHAAYRARQEEMEVSLTAVYDKLNHTEPGVMAALVEETTQDLLAVRESLGVDQPGLLAGYELRILDGNWLAATEKRLNVHQSVAGAALPGKSLVVYDPDRDVMLHVLPCEDGHAQERSMLGAVLPLIQPKQGWLADRNFCTVGFLRGIRERQGYALIRQHAQLPLIERSAWSEAVAGPDGLLIREQVVEIDGARYRRIRLELPQKTRDGDRILDLISDFPETVRASVLAELYRKRWTIESAFQRLEGHFHSELKTLAYPRAALFGFCLAVIAYNVFSLAKATLDSVHAEPVSQTLSTDYLGHEIAATFRALFDLTDGTEWHFIPQLSRSEFAQWLQQIAQRMAIQAYRKTGRGPKKPRLKVPHDPKQPHVSTQKLLLQAKRKKTLADVVAP